MVSSVEYRDRRRREGFEEFVEWVCIKMEPILVPTIGTRIPKTCYCYRYRSGWERWCAAPRQSVAPFEVLDAATVDEKVVVIGVERGPKMAHYDVVRDVWTDLPGPPAIFTGCTVVQKTKVFAYRPGFSDGWIYAVFDLTTATWSDVDGFDDPDASGGVHDCSTFTRGSDVFLAITFDQILDDDSDDDDDEPPEVASGLRVFNVETNEWRIASTYETCLESTTGVTVGNRHLLCGNLFPRREDHDKLIPSMFRVLDYDPSADQWNPHVNVVPLETIGIPKRRPVHVATTGVDGVLALAPLPMNPTDGTYALATSDFSLTPLTPPFFAAGDTDPRIPAMFQRPTPLLSDDCHCAFLAAFIHHTLG